MVYHGILSLLSMAMPVFALKKRNVPVSVSHNKHLEGEQQVAIAMPITCALLSLRPPPSSVPVARTDQGGGVVLRSQTAVRGSRYVKLMEWGGVM